MIENNEEKYVMLIINRRIRQKSERQVRSYPAWGPMCRNIPGSAMKKEGEAGDSMYGKSPGGRVSMCEDERRQ
jgi:hypothetical protein